MLLKSEDLDGGFPPRARHQWDSPDSMANQIDTKLRLGDIDVDVGWFLTMLTNGHPGPIAARLSTVGSSWYGR